MDDFFPLCSPKVVRSEPSNRLVEIAASFDPTESKIHDRYTQISIRNSALFFHHVGHTVFMNPWDDEELTENAFSYWPLALCLRICRVRIHEVKNAIVVSAL